MMKKEYLTIVIVLIFAIGFYFYDSMSFSPILKENFQTRNVIYFEKNFERIYPGLCKICESDYDCFGLSRCDGNCCVKVECFSDGDCVDDGLFCTKPEMCVDYECYSEGNPCEDWEICDEVIDSCVVDQPVIYFKPVQDGPLVTGETYDFELLVNNAGLNNERTDLVQWIAHCTSGVEVQEVNRPNPTDDFFSGNPLFIQNLGDLDELSYLIVENPGDGPSNKDAPIAVYTLSFSESGEQQLYLSETILGSPSGGSQPHEVISYEFYIVS